MNALEEFNVIVEKLRNTTLCGFKAYSVDKILTIPTQEVLQGAFKISFPQFLKAVLSCFLKNGYIYSFDTIKNAKTVLFYSHEHAARKDYVQFMETVASCSDDTVLFTGQSNKGGLLSNIKLQFYSFEAPFLLLSWIIAFWREGISKKYWRKYLISLSYSYKWKVLLNKNRDNVLSIKSMISIFDAREYENVFSQYLSLHGIPTATLQHGHYSSEYYTDPQHFYIGIGYRGFVSDFFLLWGDSSYNNALKCGLPKEKLLKVGCPSLITPKRISGKEGAIGLLFDGGKHSIADNKNMYAIANRYAKERNKKLVIKLHPSYKSSEYTFFIEDENVELYDGDLESFAKNVEFTICCNTSCLIYLLIWEHPIVHYAPVYMYDVYSELKPYSFSKYEELISIINKKVHPETMLALYTEVDHVRDKYKSVFDRIIMN